MDPDIVRGLKRREPSIDFREAAGTIPDETPDLEVLRNAAEAGRVLVSFDVATMPGHFARFLVERNSPGLILVSSRKSIGDVIEGLLLVWLNWSPEDLHNQGRWLP
jgi:hypothetical protein